MYSLTFPQSDTFSFDWPCYGVSNSVHWCSQGLLTLSSFCSAAFLSSLLLSSSISFSKYFCIWIFSWSFLSNSNSLSCSFSEICSRIWVAPMSLQQTRQHCWYRGWGCSDLLIKFHSHVFPSFEALRLPFFTAPSLDFLLHFYGIHSIDLHHLIQSFLLNLHLTVNQFLLQDLCISYGMAFGIQDHL